MGGLNEAVSKDDSAVERADVKVIVTYFRRHSNWTFIVVTNIDGFDYSRLEAPLASTLCNNDVYRQEQKISIHKFRARIIVSLSCITDFALAFFMGCPAALDGATMKKAHANEYVEAMAMALTLE